ncbi:MAG: toxic anion resistance protein, partial [Lachnospiraceae bacterium]|nr:toxic anion resistance protein [Lachnospiraceae bacterium]
MAEEMQAQVTPTLSFGEETPSAPTLSFGKENTVTTPVQSVATDMKKELDDSMLSEEERKQVDEFAEKIDLANTSAIINYGVNTQKKMTEFSEQTLNGVKTKDMGEVGDMVTNLILELKNFNVDEEEKGFLGIFKKGRNKIETLKTQYNKVETNVSTIANELQKHHDTLMSDISTLDKMYELNLNYYKELTMYILAGKKKLEHANTVELPELQKKAAESGLPEDAQAAKDYADLITRFEKKLYDIELTRTVSLQMGPQIRMVQSSDNVMVEKIQTTIVNTIPLWKNQMVIALGVEHASQAAAVQKEVSDMTNALLKSNADKLKTATIDAAKESERGIVDLETLQHTNSQLISTLDEVLTIQKEGKAKRAEAEKELATIENQLKEKML